MRSVLLVLFVLMAVESLQAPGGRAQSADGIDFAFMIPDSTLVPEGIAHDPVSGVFFLSSTYQRKVVRVDADGTVTDFVPAAAHGLLARSG